MIITTPSSFISEFIEVVRVPLNDLIERLDGKYTIMFVGDIVLPS